MKPVTNHALLKLCHLERTLKELLYRQHNLIRLYREIDNYHQSKKKSKSDNIP